MMLYRYETEDCPRTVKVRLVPFQVLRETPCGYWFLPLWINPQCRKDLAEKRKRWVSKTAKKRYCYPTKESAFESYQARTRGYVDRLRYRLAVAETAEKIAAEKDVIKKAESDW